MEATPMDSTDGVNQRSAEECAPAATDTNVVEASSSITPASDGFTSETDARNSGITTSESPMSSSVISHLAIENLKERNDPAVAPCEYEAANHGNNFYSGSGRTNAHENVDKRCNDDSLHSGHTNAHENVDKRCNDDSLHSGHTNAHENVEQNSVAIMCTDILEDVGGDITPSTNVEVCFNENILIDNEHTTIIFPGNLEENITELALTGNSYILKENDQGEALENVDVVNVCDDLHTECSRNDASNKNDQNNLCEIDVLTVCQSPKPLIDPSDDKLEKEQLQYYNKDVETKNYNDNMLSNLSSNDSSGLDESVLEFERHSECKQNSEVSDTHINEVCHSSTPEVTASQNSQTSSFSMDLGSKFSDIVGNLQGHIQKTEQTGSGESSSGITSSVFKVFRGVAKTVSGNDRENLNENFKQVYRNVMKNVSGDKFGKQGVAHKYNVDTSSKNSSTDNLSQTSGDSIKHEESLKQTSLSKNYMKTSASTDDLDLDELDINNVTSSNSKYFTILEGDTSSDVNNVSLNNKETIHIDLKRDFNFDCEDESECENKECERNDDHALPRKMSTNSDAPIPSLLSSASKTTSLQELNSKFSPALFRRNIFVSKNSTNSGSNTALSSQSSVDVCNVAKNVRQQHSLVVGSSTYTSAESSDTEPILPVQLNGQKPTLNDKNVDLDDAEQAAAAAAVEEDDDDEIFQKVSRMERCELIGQEKGELVDFTLNLRRKVFSAREAKNNLNLEVQRLKSNSSHVLCQEQIEGLEVQLQEARSAASEKELALQQQMQQQLAEHLSIRASLTDQMELLTKQFREANANKESMVIKYAMAEKNVLVAQKQRDNFEKRIKELEKDKDVLLARVKNISGEKTRYMQILDKKVQEYSSLNKECEKLKEEINSRDVKLKWTQNKLKSEMETHKAVHDRLEAAEASIREHEREMEAVRVEAEKTVNETLSDNSNRANVLDKEVTEHKSRLIVEASCIQRLKEELSSVRSALSSMTSQNSSLSSQVKSLKQQLAAASSATAESEALFHSLQQQLQSAQQTNTSLNHKLEQQGTIQDTLNKVRLELATCQAALNVEKNKVSQQESEISLLKSKEAELLAFTQTLSETNSKIQSQLNQNSASVEAWQTEKCMLDEELNKVKVSRAEMKQQLTQELSETRARLEAVCGELQQQTQATGKLLDRVAELEGEIALMTNRYNNAVKDLNRELQKMRRKVGGTNNGLSEADATVDQRNSNSSSRHDSSEQSRVVKNNSRMVASPQLSPRVSEHSITSGSSCAGHGLATTSSDPSPSNTPNDALSQASRTSSSTSLNNGVTGDSHVPQIAVVNADSQQHLMAQRIIKLQKMLAKRAEKEEFQDEHIKQLVSELQKKNKIIDYFVAKEQPGLMTGARDDAAKVRMMEQKGIMSSIYWSQQKDNTMTLELSLEINKKLQALFEDTLLKNITLKDSLNTLGEEVARLSMTNSRLNRGQP